jgi:hypothetical protein
MKEKKTHQHEIDDEQCRRRNERGEQPIASRKVEIDGGVTVEVVEVRERWRAIHVFRRA